ncbi:hypothetical protein GCM10011613_10600 [Cellvibrio zantedeschiae]|uniref:Pilus assembly protein PilZ n=1 Tax=Cellvibrio zantedeschiae TaxID=1237077 RepID=A0ABQ3AYL5_9GAMM|nr:hypothetical protein [Cellvibrio zantedeschiae]GGY68273.1 hypothetical protein GCM10011613_10600 [Cellvibrio zantedeschiae]
MGYSQLQGRFGLFESGYSSSRRISKNQSSLVLGIIVFAHALIILFVLTEKNRQRELVPEKILHMINVLPESEELISELNKPEVNELRSLQLNIPQMQITEPVISSLDTPIDNLPYEPPSEASRGNENVFDPKMRQKLLDAKRLNVPRAAEKSNTWTAIDGRTYIEMGDGTCMVSMPKVDSRDRGTSWGFTTCGKTDSEKAMDRVNADFESRRGPINKPKTNQ